MAGVRNSKIQLWAANHANPLAATACQLNLSEQGDLSLQSDGSRRAWSTGTAGVGVQKLVLHDSGNLVLSGAQGRPVWQSFQQSPVFYVVAEMNFTTNTTLFSALAADPNSHFSVAGKHGMKLGSGGRLFLYTNRNNDVGTPFVYWSYGIDSNSKPVAYATIEDNGIMFYDNKSTVLGSINPTISVAAHGLQKKLMIGKFSGNLKASYFNDSWTVFYNSSIAACENPYYCGDQFSICDPATAHCSCPTGFKNTSSGCEPSNNDFAGCITSKRSTFVTVNVSFHPQMSALSPKSPKDCQTSCSENCRCTAALYDSRTGSCSLFSALQTVSKAGNGSQLLFLKIVAERDSAKKWEVVGGTVAFAALSLWVAFCCYRRARCRGKSVTEELFLSELARLPPRFSYRDLQAATKDFSIKLGSGGFGSVYEGVLPSGIKIAVKKLEGGQDQSWDQFRAEVATIGSISHVNLVRLRGFCLDEGVRLLVYEHMANGSLDKWLFASTSKAWDPSRRVLDWERRYTIALETARGLAYLHHDSQESIVHCDVKPENILLDSHMCAKVADFGLAKLVPGGHQSFAMTTLKGTRGYLAPEWLRDATITPRIDVYSFGVVLLELVSGRRCLDGDIGYLPIWAMRAAVAIATPSSPPPHPMHGPPPTVLADEHDHLTQMLDTRLHGSVPLASLKRLVSIALWCVQSRPATRPTMATLVQMLEGVIDVPPPPLLLSPSFDGFSSCPTSQATMSASSFPDFFATTVDLSQTLSSSSDSHMLTSSTNCEGNTPSSKPSSWLLEASHVQ